MRKNAKQIKQLNYGELHIYYPIRFDTKLSYLELCDTMFNSDISFNDEYQQKLMDAL